MSLSHPCSSSFPERQKIREMGEKPDTFLYLVCQKVNCSNNCRRKGSTNPPCSLVCALQTPPLWHPRMLCGIQPSPAPCKLPLGAGLKRAPGGTEGAAVLPLTLPFSAHPCRGAPLAPCLCFSWMPRDTTVQSQGQLPGFI